MRDGSLNGRLPKIKQQHRLGARRSRARHAHQRQMTAVRSQLQPKIRKTTLLNQFTRQRNGRLPQRPRKQPTTQPDRFDLLPKRPMLRLPISPRLLVKCIAALEREQEVGQGTAVIFSDFVGGSANLRGNGRQASIKLLQQMGIIGVKLEEFGISGDALAQGKAGK